MTEQFIAHYRVIQKLRSGGMGDVFLAEDTRLERQVAIKLLPDELTEETERRRRFIAEAKAASALNHPHVCVIFEVGVTEDDRPFIAMELLEGEPLDQILKKERLDVGRIVAIGIQIADALDTAHRKNIVHRDIKPANIWLGVRDHVKVLDFGLAKRLAFEDTDTTLQLALTQEGQLLGTPGYMSPEQALGREVDGRSDIFSLGIVLYEMITGRAPFAGSSLGDTLSRIVSSRPAAMSRFNYDLSPELERIVLKSLHKDPNRRYQSARELMVDLENLRQTLVTEGSGSDLSYSSGIVPVTGVNAPPGSSPDSHGSGSGPLPTPADLRNSDIVISCARIDDEPMLPDREGWTSQFRRNLGIRLELLLGEPVRVISCPMPAGEQEWNEGLLDVLPTAKALVSVVSPPFTKSRGCLRSIEKFCAEHSPESNRSRLFKVVKSPVDGDSVPGGIASHLNQVLSYDFYEEDPATGRIREFDERFGEAARQRYHERVYDLAQEISHALRTLKQDSSASVDESVGHRVVYLGTTTSDLTADRATLRRELTAQGFRVVPEYPLPLVLSDLETEVRQLLSDAVLSVHPVGGMYGVIPEGADQSLPEIQHRLAVEAGVERLVWLPRDQELRDARQGAWIEALRLEPGQQRHAELVEDRLGAFKAALLDRLQPQEEPNSDRSAGGPPRLYLICDQQDEEATEQLEDFLFEQGIEVILPAFVADEAEVQKMHLTSLRDCDAALVFFGAAGKHWVDFHVRDLIKAAGYRDGRPIEFKAVYVAPPFDRRKERYRSLSVEVIRQTSDFDPQAVSSLIRQIRATQSDS